MTLKLHTLYFLITFYYNTNCPIHLGKFSRRQDRVTPLYPNILRKYWVQFLTIRQLNHHNQEKKKTFVKQKFWQGYFSVTKQKKENLKGLSGSRTRDLSHPKRESCHQTNRPFFNLLRYFLQIAFIGNIKFQPASSICWSVTTRDQKKPLQIQRNDVRLRWQNIS